MIRLKRNLSNRAVFFIVITSVIFLSPLSWWLQKSAVVVIHSPVSGSQVWVDGMREGRTGGLGGEISLRLTAGEHSVIVSKEGFYPWARNISVHAGGRTAISAFLFPEVLALEEISPVLPNSEKQNEEFQRISNLIDQNSSAELLPILGTLSLPEITSAVLAPGREDVIFVSSQGIVFAISTTIEEPRNFHPLYSGERPRLTVLETTLYIGDAGKIYAVDVGSYI